jgi:hypothetical protein
MSQESSISILHGDGKTPETAIRFSECERSERIRAEREYICSQYGEEGVDWHREVHFTTMDLKSNWNIELSDGRGASIYFDTYTGDTE